ncbi:uncharacterized protein HD556DRAFT_1422965 [Suillus plorans]|uniref:Uncharacterized protein n=1 Tax=Suillus plorans TaxID=116603 RepID=A0A9P7D9P3_9AGAM|nr:uncharacterized protein HD556DRAFT_1422965 [Suillus plorans]KAG1785385.1 hypothetical protein HD556DRAFT_1422965 [Suillus plorans]
MHGRHEGTSLAALVNLISVILVQYLQPDVFCLMITKMYHYQQRGLLVTPFQGLVDRSSGRSMLQLLHLPITQGS